jgi:hypothetical protein
MSLPLRPVVAAFSHNNVLTMVYADGRYARYVYSETDDRMVWMGYEGPSYAQLFHPGTHSASGS